MQKCIRCKSSMKDGASICVKCGGYQSRLRNALVFFAGVAGVFAAIGSAVIFIVTSLPDARKLILPNNNIRVFKFSIAEGISGFNIGDGKIFVSHVQIVFPKREGVAAPREILLPINKFIEQGAPIEAGFDGAAGYLIEDMEQSQWESLIRTAPDATHKKPCIVVDAANENAPWLVTIRKHLRKKFREQKVDTSLHYFAGSKNTLMKLNIPASAFLYGRHDCESK